MRVLKSKRKLQELKDNKVFLDNDLTKKSKASETDQKSSETGKKHWERDKIGGLISCG